MKSTALALSFALGLAPAISVAQQSATPAPAPQSEEPTAGGVAQGPLPAFGSLPAGTIVVGGFVVLAATGVVLGVFTGEDNPTSISATGTN